MAENPEEHLDSSLIPLSENLLNQDNSSTETGIINTHTEIENMEVHTHPHHVTHKKKLPEYLLEFFMLFLAVFLGFLAENFREHQVAKEKEKIHMENVLEDLKADTAIYNN